MNANELRLGNYVNVSGNPAVIRGIKEDGVIANILTNIGEIEPMYGLLEPIPLTEEWLVKFGFEIRTSNKHIYEIQAKHKFFELIKEHGHSFFTVSFYTYYDDVVFDNFKYVHQLQNLYFALTGQELEQK